MKWNKIGIGAAFLSAAAIFFTGCASQTELPPPPAPRSSEPVADISPYRGTFSDLRQNHWNDRVFYEIFVRSFKDSDGDGIGDLRGIIDSLDYLNDGDPSTGDDLGITGIWLMPVNSSPSYHGYDVTDYFSINSDYGTMDDFRELLSEAHKRGIIVIMDLVLNHTSTEHPWFQKSRSGDPDYINYYRWADGRPDLKGPWGQDVWHGAGGNRSYYGLFWSGMPDLNYNNEKVTEEVYDIIDFWLSDIGVDGFRLDAIMYLIEEGNELMNTFSTLKWFENFHSHYKAVNPDAFTIGEVWSTTENSVEYVGDKVDTVFEFDLASSMVGSVQQSRNSAIYAQQENVLENYPESQYGRFLTNHDQDRIATVLNGSRDKLKMAASLLLTGPGVPFIYYGEEIGMEGGKPDENIRRPYPWTGTGGFTSGKPWEDYGPGKEENNLQSQRGVEDSLYEHYRSLISLRNEIPALRKGGTFHINTDSRKVYSFVRYDEEEAYLVILNLGREMEGPGFYAEKTPWPQGFSLVPVFGSAEAADLENPDGEGGFSRYQPLDNLEAYSTYVFRIVPHN
ncbi:MAG: alpha-amylase [Spirochaetales bacterium]|nr:alpha-amylase [Spirochaetales bacterium]